MAADISWSDIQLAEDPRLLIGSRSRPRHLDAARVELHVDTFQTLRSIASSALATLSSTVGRDYEPFAELEEGEEHFVADVNTPEPGDDDSATADILHLLRAVDDLSTLDARNLVDQRSLFYALCWPAPGGGTAFVKKTDPARAVRNSRSFIFRDALRRTDNPNMILSDSTDFVVCNGTAGILRPTPFRQLFSDIDVALSEVPRYVSAVRLALRGSIPLSDDATETLERVVAQRPSFALRLRRLSVRLTEIQLTRETLLEAATRHLDDAGALINDSGELEFDQASVAVFLDLAEGRLFEDDFSGQHRRADRFSSR